MSIFGRIVTNSMVEAAVLELVNVWADTGLAEVERQSGVTVGLIQRPRAYAAAFDFDNWQEEQLPAVYAVSPGPAQLERAGGDRYTAIYPLDVGVFVNDQTEPLVRGAASAYQMAVAMIVAQNGGIGALAATRTEWIGGALRLPDPDNRTLALATCEFHIVISDVLDGGAGPASPNPAASPEYGGAPEAPFNAWPTVSSTIVAAHARPI